MRNCPLMLANLKMNLSLKQGQTILFIIFSILMQACIGTTSIQETALMATSASPTPFSQKFATGTKGVKILLNTATGGSFSAPVATPTPKAIPSDYPGYDGTTTFNPGLSASTYYDLDGTTSITRPSWLLDFEVGITSTSASSACAAFGGTGSLDVQNTFRTSEVDCNSSSNNGVGAGTDPIFMRAVLNRDNAYLGSAENLLVQIEYQASGLHLNSDGSNLTNPEDNLDQLWKIFWNSTLGNTALPKPFAVFVPPQYSACISNGTGNTGAPGNCSSASYKGSPVKVRQFVIPLSAYPTLSVLQISRLAGRTNKVGAENYVNNFCVDATSVLQHDSPLCLGVAIQSVTLMRF